MSVDRDRDLLVAVFAVQIRGIAPDQLAGAVAAWDAEPTISLGRHMAEQGLIEEQDLALLEELVDQSLAAHGGDAAAVLQLFGGEAHVRKLFFGSATSSYLDHVDTAPMEDGESVSGIGQGASGVSETPGRYTLISHHARGGMGRVLIVHDEYLGRNIALKELMPMTSAGGGDEKPTPMRQSASLIARFLQEARITSQLEHPAIVPVYEVGRRRDGTLYYTMRLVRGKTFSAALRECEGLDERLRLLANFVGLCQAIAYAHSRGIIHRDIKPANVMLGQFGETVVLDWGLAKLRDAEDIHVEDIKEALRSLELEGESPLPLTAYGRALGTPHYMPPEQAAGEIAAIDERSDVYSLGAVLYEILTGTTPHSGRNTREIVEKVLHEEPVPVLEMVPDAPPELAVICEKALGRAAANRYQTAAELAAEVERFVQGSLVRAYRYSPGQILAHYYAKHRPLVNTAVACALLLLAAGVASYFSILQARNREHDQRLAAEAARHNENIARTIAERKTYQSQIHLAQAYISSHESARASEALWETTAAERGWEWGYLLNRANPDAYAVTTPKSDLYSAVFSPDGSRIGTNTYPEPPAIYDAATGRKRVDLEGEPMKCNQTVFSPDGSLYMGVGTDGVINLWDTATGRRVRRFVQHAMGYDAVFNASGSMVFAGYGDKKIRAYDLSAGEVAYELDTGETSSGAVAVSPAKDRLLAATGAVTTQLWDLGTRTLLFSLSGSVPVFSPDGMHIANVQGSEAVLWDAESGAELCRFKGHGMAIYDLSFSRDGRKLLSASQDGSVMVWDTGSAAALQRYTLPDAMPAWKAFFLASESAVLAYTGDNRCLVYSGTSNLPVYQFQGRGKTPQMMGLQPNGTLLLLVPGEHDFQVTNPLAPTGLESVIVNPQPGDATCEVISAADSGKLLALSSASSHGVCLVDPVAKQQLCAYTASLALRPSDAALSSDGTRLAMNADGFVPVVISDPAGVPTRTVFTGHAAQVTALALRPDGMQVASGDTAGTVFLWNAESAQPDRTLSVQGGAVSCLNFSRNGQRLLSVGLEGTVTMWDVGTGAAVLTLPKQTQPMVSAAFNDSATRIITVTTGGVAQLWDAQTGTMTASTQVGMGQPNDSAVSNGRWINAQFWPGDRQFAVRFPYEGRKLWDTATLTPLLFFDEDEAVQPMNNGRTLAAVDRRGNVRTENIPDGTHPLTPDAYAQYRREWATRTAFVNPTGAAKTYVFISREDLALALADLARMEGAPQETGGVSLNIAATTRTQHLAEMGLRAGDGVAAIDGAAFADLSAAKAALEAAARKIGGEAQGSFAVKVSRKEKAMERIYWTLPLESEERPVALTRDEALGLLQGQLDDLMTEKHSSPDAAWLDRFNPPNSEIAGKTQLPGRMALTAIDGKPFDSMEALEQALNLLRQRIAAESPLKFTQAFHEGVYREHTRTFTVAGG